MEPGPARVGPLEAMQKLILAGMVAIAAIHTPARAQSPAPAAAGATAIDLAGVRYAPTASVGSSTLRLNGAGIRTRFVVQVYTAGLYLGARADTPEAVLAAPGAKRLHVVMLRDIDASELGRLFTRGMQDNAPKEEFSKSVPGTLRMADIFSEKKRLAKGENFSVDFVPGVGTQVLVNGKPAGEPIAEPEFFRALMAIWLGPNPADAALKQALLGQAAPAAYSRQR